MMLELKEVLIEGEPLTLSLAADAGRIMCITGGTAERLTRLTHAILGFAQLRNGYISIDGEPLEDSNADEFRRMIAYVPARLEEQGEVHPYLPPTVQDVFQLKANRNLPISNGILAEEVKRVATDISDPRTQLLAVAVLLDKPILLVDDMLPEGMDYLRSQAQRGKTVIVTSLDERVVKAADDVFEIE